MLKVIEIKNNFSLIFENLFFSIWFAKSWLCLVKFCSEKHFAGFIKTLHNFDPDGQLRILTCSEMAPKMSLYGLSNS